MTAASLGTNENIGHRLNATSAVPQRAKQPANSLHLIAGPCPTGHHSQVMTWRYVNCHTSESCGLRHVIQVRGSASKTFPAAGMHASPSAVEGLLMRRNASSPKWPSSSELQPRSQQLRQPCGHNAALAAAAGPRRMQVAAGAVAPASELLPQRPRSGGISTGAAAPLKDGPPGPSTGPMAPVKSELPRRRSSGRITGASAPLQDEPPGSGGLITGAAPPVSAALSLPRRSMGAGPSTAAAPKYSGSSGPSMEAPAHVKTERPLGGVVPVKAELPSHSRSGGPSKEPLDSGSLGAAAPGKSELAPYSRSGRPSTGDVKAEPPPYSGSGRPRIESSIPGTPSSSDDDASIISSSEDCSIPVTPLPRWCRYGKEVTAPGVTAPDQEVTEPGVTAPDQEVTEPGVTAPDQEVTEPRVTASDQEVTEPGVTAPDQEVTEPGVTAPDQEVTEPIVATWDSPSSSSSSPHSQTPNPDICSDGGTKVPRGRSNSESGSDRCSIKTRGVSPTLSAASSTKTNVPVKPPLSPSAEAVETPEAASARCELARAQAAAIVEEERVALNTILDLTARVTQATCLLDTAVSTLDPAMVGSSADTMQLLDDLHSLCPQNNMWHRQKEHFHKLKTACRLAAVATAQLSADASHYLPTEMKARVQFVGIDATHN